MITVAHLTLHFCSTQIYYPFTMFVRIHNPEGRVKKLMFATSVFCLFVSVLAIIGSTYALATAGQS